LILLSKPEITQAAILARQFLVKQKEQRPFLWNNLLNALISGLEVDLLPYALIQAVKEHSGSLEIQELILSLTVGDNGKSQSTPQTSRSYR
jgi:hypothetical protein